MVYDVLSLPAEEAAAFVAALSRYINSPRAASPGNQFELVEIRARIHQKRQDVELFLNSIARDAATQAFGSLPHATRTKLDLEDFERTSVILQGPQVPALGADEAKKLLFCTPQLT